MKRETRAVNLLAIAVVALLLAGCSSNGGHAKPAELLPAQVKVTPLAGAAEDCAGVFVGHALDHTTTVPGGEQVRNFEANGSGVAINDLDNDGDLDIVLGNHAGPNTILWNGGGLDFRAEHMEVGDTRSVAIVDLDGDGWQDILLTRTGSAPNYWHNGAASEAGRRSFTQFLLPAVGRPLYAANWGDLDADGDLDLVGATYDAGLLDQFGVDNAETAAAWQPVLRALLSDAHPEGDPQASENMFQVRGKDGALHNEATARGLDIVVNNLRAQARLFENQLCEGSSLQVDLFWPGSGNSRGLGATLALHTREGTAYRQVKAASGYLSGDAARVHFGLAEGSEPDWLEIRWPDGEISVVQDLAAGTLLSITRE